MADGRALPDSNERLERFRPRAIRRRGLRNLAALPLFALYSLLAVGALQSTMLFALIPIALPILMLIAESKLHADDVAFESHAVVLRRRSRSRRLRLGTPREGWIEQSRSGVAVCVKLARQLVLVCEVDDEATAQRMLTSAGVDAERRVVAWRLARSPREWALLIGAATGAYLWWLRMLFSASPGLAVHGALLASVVVAVIYAATRRSRVHLGADGLVLRGPLRQRFVAYRDIQDASRRAERIDLILSDERRITLRPGLLGKEDKLRPSKERTRELSTLLRARLALSNHENPEASSLQHALERRSESVADWRRRMNRLVHAGYRMRAVTGDDLGYILESHSASAEQRIGAALALVESGAPGTLNRVRIAVERCAEPKLRVVLEHVADANDEQIERLIDEAETADPPERRTRA